MTTRNFDARRLHKMAVRAVRCWDDSIALLRSEWAEKDAREKAAFDALSWWGKFWAGKPGPEIFELCARHDTMREMVRYRSRAVRLAELCGAVFGDPLVSITDSDYEFLSKYAEDSQ